MCVCAYVMCGCCVRACVCVVVVKCRDGPWLVGVCVGGTVHLEGGGMVSWWVDT